MVAGGTGTPRKKENERDCTALRVLRTRSKSAEMVNVRNALIRCCVINVCMIYLRNGIFLEVHCMKKPILFIACIGIATLLGCPEEPADVVVDTTAPALSIQIGSVSVSDGQVLFSLTNPNNEVVEGRISVEPAPPSRAIYTVDGSVIEGDARISLASADSDGATKQVQITRLNNGTEYTITVTTFDTAGNARSVTDTTSQTPGIGYICTNGVATGGIAAAAETERCTSCAAGYVLSGTADAEGTVCAPHYICTNGVATGGIAATENIERCTSCAAGYALSGTADAEGTVCAPHYICTNGVATGGIAATAETERCTSCAAGYALGGTADAEGTVCLARVYTCENGSPIPGQPTTTSSQGCATCENGHYLSAEPGAGAACIENAYACENGSPIPGVPTNNGEIGCATCNTGYQLSTIAAVGTTCLADAHGNTLMDATPVTDGSSTTGRINPGNDVDYFAIEIMDTGTLTTFTTGSLDTFGRLYDSRGRLLATENDGGDDANFLITHSITTAGTYYILVGSAGDDIGDYTLMVSVTNDDHGNRRADATTVTDGSSTIGRIDPSNDVDYFEIEITRATALTAFTTGSLDTIGKIFDSDGTQLATHNDISGVFNTNFLVAHSITAIGIYYIEVSSDLSDIGEYTLTVNLIDDDHGNGRMDATTVTDGSSTAGRIDPSIDVDYFKIAVMSTGTLTASTTGSLDTVGRIFDSSGIQVDLHNNIDFHGGNKNFLVAYDIMTTGTYYIEVESEGPATGDYTLMVDLIDDDQGDTPMNAAIVTDGSTTVGSIRSSSDVDYFKISVMGTTTLAAFTTGSTNTMGRILDSHGVEIATNDDIDGAGNRNFLVTYDIMTTGIYYIEVTSSESDTGNYILMVDLVDDDHGDAQIDATTVTDGSSIMGTIDPGDDVDYFAITVMGSGTLTASTTGSLDTIGKIFDNHGTLLAEHDDIDGSNNRNFLVTYDIMVAGTYYIEVASYLARTGEYTLAVDFDPE